MPSPTWWRWRVGATAAANCHSRFHHADVARAALPGAGAFDVLVSMHTLYWHPDPAALLAACRRALKPGGHAVFLTYERPARVPRTFAEVRRQHGWGAAIRALRWLLPTAIFDLFRGIDPRYLTREEFDAALQDAGFEILERRTTFLAGISMLAWARTAPVGAGREALISFSPMLTGRPRFSLRNQPGSAARNRGRQGESRMVFNRLWVGSQVWYSPCSRWRTGPSGPVTPRKGEPEVQGADRRSR